MNLIALLSSITRISFLIFLGINRVTNAGVNNLRLHRELEIVVIVKKLGFPVQQKIGIKNGFDDPVFVRILVATIGCAAELGFS